MERTLRVMAPSEAAGLDPLSQGELLAELEIIASMRGQGKEKWRVAFKQFLGKLSRFNSWNKERNGIYNQQLFAAMLTEYNVANSRQTDRAPLPARFSLSNSESLAENLPTGTQTAATHLAVPRVGQDQVSLTRNLENDFRNQRPLKKSIWASVHSPKIELEDLKLVKRPPEHPPKSQSDGLPSGADQSQEQDAAEGRAGGTAKRRGSFDLIETDEEIDGMLGSLVGEMYRILVSDGFRPEVLRPLFEKD